MSRSDEDVTSAAELFEVLWESLADMLGTAATATLLRRAKQTASQTSGSGPVVVIRSGMDYEYRLPAAWSQPGNGARRAVLDSLTGAHVGPRFQDLRGVLTGIPQPARGAGRPDTRRSSGKENR